MALDTILKGVSSGNGAEVNAANEQLVKLGDVALLAGFARIADNAGVAAQFSDQGRIKAGLESLLFHDPIDGSALNTNLWATDHVTMTATINGGFILLNGGAITTINTRARLTSTRMMPFIAHFPLAINIRFKTPNVPQSNATMELGLGNATAVAAPTDGVFVRWASDGVFRCVVAASSVETTAVVTAPTVNTSHNLVIYYTYREARFMLDGVLVATIPFPTAGGSLTGVSRLPILARVSTGGSAPSLAPQLSISEPNVAQMDLNWSKDWGDQIAGIGRGAYQSPISTFQQTANHANSTSPSSASLSNTAAGYTTLGGRWQFAAPAGAGTDFCLFGFQVPAGYQLKIKKMQISAVNTGAAVATTATILDWSIAVGSSGVSLATAEAAGTAWAPRRIPVGIMGFLVGAGIGAVANTIDCDFPIPLVCDAGRFVQVIVQVPVGTATASQVIRGNVKINGYFE